PAAVSSCVGMRMFGAIPSLPPFLQGATGASASTSGLLIVPIMLGLLTSSIIAGQIITRTGRYRRFPIIGMAVTATAMYLLSTLDTTSSRLESGPYLAPLGPRLRLGPHIPLPPTPNQAPAP